MSSRGRLFFTLLAVGALLVVAPLLGVLVTGHELAPYLKFPPLPHQAVWLRFSLTAFLVLAAVMLVVVLAFDDRVMRHRKQCPSNPPPVCGSPRRLRPRRS